MRITPSPEDGLHPAFPTRPDQSASCTPLPTTVSVATDFGLLRLVFAFTFGKPAPFISASKTIAHAAAVLTPALAIMEIYHRITIRNFLSSQDIDPRKQKLFDRLGSLDEDDYLMLGGCLGVFAASRMRKPWAITGWRRQLAAFTVGSCVSDATYWSFRNWSRTPDEQAKYQLDYQKWREHRSEWWKLVSRYGPLYGLVSSSATFKIDQIGMGVGDLQNQGLMTKSPTGQPAIGLQEKVVKDGPHAAVQLPDDPEPFPIPATNYTWSSSQPIEDLERHITKLTEQRQRLAQEAEFLWAWLSEKEAEYYSQADSNAEPDTPETRKRLYYLGHLGAAHSQIWREVSSYDWMIADSHKRIEQLRSRLANQDEEVTWRARCSEAARETKPEYAIRSLGKVEHAASATLDQMRMAAASLHSPVVENTAKNSKERMMNPIQNKVTTMGECVEDMEREMKKALEDFELTLKVAGDLKADLEKRHK